MRALTVWHHSGTRSPDVDGAYQGGHVSVLPNGVSGTSEHCNSIN
ncbi:MAG TPA: hypothetical protein VFX16_08265 [Pseudonocardiaceae bacterium]|nr:hypothetical protein [Pseudonocardiaceae bacterium]